MNTCILEACVCVLFFQPPEGTVTVVICDLPSDPTVCDFTVVTVSQRRVTKDSANPCSDRELVSEPAWAQDHLWTPAPKPPGATTPRCLCLTAWDSSLPVSSLAMRTGHGIIENLKNTEKHPNQTPKFSPRIHCGTELAHLRVDGGCVCLSACVLIYCSFAY